MSPSPLHRLPAKDRAPNSVRTLTRWVEDARRAVGTPGGDRIGWLLASTIVVAALQRAADRDGEPLFLLKGGVYLEHRLGDSARATKDVDALFRGEVETFVDALDRALEEPWGPLTLTRSKIEQISADRIIKPVRFDVVLAIRGATFRRIQVEVAFPKGRIADAAEQVPAPPLGFFGITSAPDLAAITMAYQVAQKIHACTDPDVPGRRNDRVRDIADLLAIRDHLYPRPDQWTDVRAACEDVFRARAAEAAALGLRPRHWPPTVTSNDIWVTDWPGLARATASPMALDQAIAEVNRWIAALSTV